MWRTNDLIPEADEEVGTVKETKQDQSGGINISRNEYAAINLLGALYITTSFLRVGSVYVVVDNEKKKNGTPTAGAPSQCVANTVSFNREGR